MKEDARRCRDSQKTSGTLGLLETSADIPNGIPIETRNAFKVMLKKGIYKELHKRSLLSDAQLNSLLKDK